MTKLHRIVLVISSDRSPELNYTHLLQLDRTASYQVVVEECSLAQVMLARSPAVDAILLELLQPTLTPLSQLLQWAQPERSGYPPVIVLGPNNATLAVQALKAGATDYLDKTQVNPDLLAASLQAAIATAHPTQPRFLTTEQLYHSVEQMLDCFGVFSAIRDATGQILDFRIDYVNQAACECNHIPCETLIGQSLGQLFPNHYETGLFEEYCQLVTTGVPLVKETALHEDTFGGTKVVQAFDLRATKFNDGFVATWRDVTASQQLTLELHQTVALLQQEQSRFQQLIEDAPIGIGIGTADGQVKIINNAMLKMHGYTRERFEQQGMNWIDFVDPDEIDRAEEAMEQIRSAGFLPPEEKELLRQDGSRIPIWISATQWLNRPDEHVAFAVDLTTQKRVEAALQDTYIQLEAALAAGSIYTWRWNIPQNQVVVDRNFACLFGLNPEEAAAGLPVERFLEAVHPDDLSDLEGAIARAIELGEPFVTEFRIHRPPVLDRWVIARGRVEYDMRGNPTVFPGALTDITERKQSEAALRESEERFRTLADNISQFAWMADTSGWMFWYNQRWFDYTGTTLEQMQGWGWRQVHHPDHVERVTAKITQCFQTGEPWEDTFPLRRYTGEYRWFLSRALPIRDEVGNILRWFGTNTDITELRQAQTALAENEARLRSFVESNVVGILFGDIYGHILNANDEFLRIIGYTRAELAALQLNWKDLTPPEYASLDEARIAEARASGGACTPYEKAYIRQDGKRIPILIGYSMYGELQEEAVAFVLDLSDRKRAERALLRSEDRLRLALEAAKLGTWDWNLVTNKLVWNERCKAMFGLPPNAKITIDTFFQYLHPDDRGHLNEVVQWALDPASGGSYDVEYRTIGAQDGIERWIAAKGQAYFNEDGAPHRFIGTTLDITEQKEADKALRESEERLQMALEGSGGGLWDWNILTNEDFLSSRWLEILGYEPGELPEKYSSWEKLIHPDDKPLVMENLYAHLQDESIPYRFECRMLSKSGEWKWIANYGKVVRRDEAGKPIRMAGIHHDISDRKQVEEKFLLSEHRYQTLANAVAQLIWVNDAAGKVVFYNQQWRSYTGLPDLELGVSLWTNVIHPDDYEITAATRKQAIAQGESYEVECRLKRHDQTYRWHLARIVPFKDTKGHIMSWFGTATDIHDRRCAEAERERLFRQEQAARAAAERANRVKDEFLAVLSHELRSPLNPILGWSKLLQTRELDADKTLRALSTIERNARLQAQLIDDLLDIAKILRGKLKLQNTRVKLVAAVESALETVKTAADAKAITIDTELQDIGDIWGDSARIQQIIWNLLSNAIKFTPHEGQVGIYLRQEQPYARITVTDTGKGINPEFLPYIFESFRQEDASITRQYGGLGLGLAIVRYLVEAHGGTIIANSLGVGSGATFTVTLPLLRTTPGPSGDNSPIAAEHNLAGIRILAVDDHPDARDFLATLLAQYGADVKVVASGQEVLATLGVFQPDVLISDLGMPEMDGYVLIQQVRALSFEEGGQVPAIALSAYAREEDQKRTLASGYQKHLPKPIEIDHLIPVILELVAAKNSLA